MAVRLDREARRPPEGGHFNFICTGGPPQTKAGPSINKNRPIPRLCTIKHERKFTKLYVTGFIQFTRKSPISSSVFKVGLMKWGPVQRFHSQMY